MLAGEVAAVWDRVEELRSGSVGYGDQAVVARTHRVLERIGAGLERHCVPVQCLGDLLVRDGVRDLLALVSTDAESGRLGLLRIAIRPPYGVPRRDIVIVIRWAAAADATAAEALRRAPTIPGIEATAARGPMLLGRHLFAAGPGAIAWTVLSTRLVEEWVNGVALRRETCGTHSQRRNSVCQAVADIRRLETCEAVQRLTLKRRFDVSLTGSNAAMVYEQTDDLRAMQILPGHIEIESTIRYLGVDVDDALALAGNTTICTLRGLTRCVSRLRSLPQLGPTVARRGRRARMGGQRTDSFGVI